MADETQTYTYHDPDPKAYWALLKPRVMSLVVFTAAAGMWVAPGELNPIMAVVAILAIAVSAGAAGAINMWYDRDIDAIMKRTAERPLPQGRMEPDNALGFGILLSLLSFMVMGLATNWVAAFLLAGANLFYVLIYTMWLKRRTPQNIVIGGAAGAFPPMIGWAAVTGDVTLVSIALFMLIFLWTPPHFWALAIYIKTDYGNAGVPMLPNVAGKRTTKRQMLAYALAMIPVAVVPWWLGSAGIFYLIVAVALSVLFAVCAVRVLQTVDDSEAEDKLARQMFGFSILYLFVVFAALIIDRANGVSLVF